jgi:gliding motility-associated-like protein
MKEYLDDLLQRMNDDSYRPGEARLEGVYESELAIYDRWGQLVYLSKNASQGWHGEIDGKPQPAGLYVWNCRYQLQKKKAESKSGTVLLIR